MFNKLRKKKHGHIHYFRTLAGVVGMLRDSENTESVFDIEEGLRHTEASRLAAEYLMSIAEVRALAEERYLQPVPDVEELAQLAPGTLGYHYAHHLKTNGFDPNYYRKIDVQNDAEYLAQRMRQTHDIWHVVTGIGVGPIDELALKAVELAQTRRPMAAVITAGGVLRYLMKEPEQLRQVMDGIHLGYTIGSHSKPLLSQKWEEQWERPLADIRAERNVAASSYLPAPG